MGEWLQSTTSAASFHLVHWAVFSDTAKRKDVQEEHVEGEWRHRVAQEEQFIPERWQMCFCNTNV